MSKESSFSDISTFYIYHMFFKTMAFDVPNNVNMHLENIQEGHDIRLLLSRDNRQPRVTHVFVDITWNAEQWKVVAFVVDITWNAEASSKLHKTVCFLSKLAQIQRLKELK